MKITFAVAVVFAAAWGSASAAALRAAGGKKQPSASQIADMVGNLVAKANSTDSDSDSDSDSGVDTDAMEKQLEAMQTTTTPAPKASAPKGHAKLDVGFQDFEKSLMEQVNASILKATSNAAWTDALRQQLEANVTVSLSEGLKAQLKPVKQDIGKTWMALPDDSQKEAYVSALKRGFESVLSSGVQTTMSHMQISLHRVENLAKDKELSKDSLLSKSEATLTEGLLAEHCYGDKAKDEKLSSQKTNASHKLSHFCIPSVLQNVVHRLNDTTGLVSMTMRFEAGAMSLAQKNKAPKKK